MAVASSTLAYAAMGWTMAATAVSAGASVASGYAAAEQARYQGEYNAEIYKQQAKVIEQQKQVEETQKNREIARIRGAVVARSGGSGLMLSGSPLAILIDNESLAQYDKAVGQYNLEAKKTYALSGAQYYKYSGEQAARSAISRGYTNAFSSILKGASSMALMGLGGGMFGGYSTSAMARTPLGTMVPKSGLGYTPIRI